jgi:ankyrin repeat protein
VTRHGWTPLHYAANSGNAALVKELLSAGAPIECDNSDGDRPMHLACRAGSAAVVKLLLGSQAECSSHNAAGDTPLILAAAAGLTHAVSLFLQRFVEPDDVNHKRQTALHQAVQHEHVAVVQALVNAGARVDIVDIYMNTPISKARAKGLDHLIDILAQAPQEALHSRSLEDVAAEPDGLIPLTHPATRSERQVTAIAVDP